MITQLQKRSLIKLVKDTISDYLDGKAQQKNTSDIDLMSMRGAFVTLYKKGQLRGCIGHIIAHKPLYYGIQELAIKSAFEDTRFTPVQKGEKDDLLVEISIISPVEKIKAPEDIKLGTHGLILKNGSRAGVFLPQIPIEQGWDLPTFISELCKKAGCSTSVLDDPKTEFLTFTAEVFS
ncbi:AMMECR1 domain-containing protein [Candidatus Marinamargulisbacteria bacterium SCGC AAA071-K20]|nr:AMMECR1 domain-containing protein [Candidatus Marinamargulisbacteria bacterium SCGC AAA071-K20]